VEVIIITCAGAVKRAVGLVRGRQHLRWLLEVLYIYIYIYIFIYIYIYICNIVYIPHTIVYIHVFFFTYIYLYMYIYYNIYIYICIYIYTRTHIHIYMYTYTYIGVKYHVTFADGMCMAGIARGGGQCVCALTQARILKVRTLVH